MLKTKEFRTFVRPIAISALSFSIICAVINKLIIQLDPSYYLLANRGVGKIVFTLVAILHMLFLMHHCSPRIFKRFLHQSVYFIITKQWIGTFFLYFILFALVHISILAGIILSGYASLNPIPFNSILGKGKTLLLGFIATFFLALTEELIFRGALYTYIKTRFQPLTSAFITSLCFSLAHNLSNPLLLVTDEWQLGLGLFLLGLFLNLLFIATKKLYICMGAHAGLVFIKVILRRLPFILFPCYTQLPWWITIDLRKSIITHTMLVIGCIILLRYIIIHKKKKFQE